jgi:hypothetical protein
MTPAAAAADNATGSDVGNNANAYSPGGVGVGQVRHASDNGHIQQHMQHRAGNALQHTTSSGSSGSSMCQACTDRRMPATMATPSSTCSMERGMLSTTKQQQQQQQVSHMHQRSHASNDGHVKQHMQHGAGNALQQKQSAAAATAVVTHAPMVTRASLAARAAALHVLQAHALLPGCCCFVHCCTDRYIGSAESDVIVVCG